MNDLVLENNLNSSLDKIGSNLTLLRDLSNEANTALDKFKEIEFGRQRIEILKLEIQRDLYLVDKQFDAYIVNIEKDLIKYKNSASEVINSLRKMEDSIDKFMDKIENLDPNKNGDMIKLYLNSINNLSEKITAILFKLL